MERKYDVEEVLNMMRAKRLEIMSAQGIPLDGASRYQFVYPKVAEELMRLWLSEMNAGTPGTTSLKGIASIMVTFLQNAVPDHIPPHQRMLTVKWFTDTVLHSFEGVVVGAIKTEIAGVVESKPVN